MSTKFPTWTPDIPLTVLLQAAERRATEALLAELTPLCPGLQAPHLALFGALDCGATHASDAALRLGISRQAVARTARELETLGLVRLEADARRRNRNLLRMTEAGETLALKGREVLAHLETAAGADLPALRRALVGLSGGGPAAS